MFVNFHKGFIFAKLQVQSLVKIKALSNGKTTLSFTDVGKPIPWVVKFLRWKYAF